ncbi:MAG: polysaccharide deacetylase family protein, partial [Gemmatimonadota bacterium]|nr:polysaccharide deacetylase family protein [Gemmatimonadota bacterium]
LPSLSESARQPAAPMSPCIQALNNSARPPAKPIVSRAPALAAAHAGLAACRHLDGNAYEAMIGYRRALGHAESGRAGLHASAGWLACRLGLYESALAEGRSAVREAPGHPLARHVLGASLLALGRAEEAVEALGRPARGGHDPVAGALLVPSAVLDPGATYWAEHTLDERERLAALPGEQAVAAETPAGDQPEVDLGPAGRDLAIVRPRAGEAVAGEVEVAVDVGGSLRLSHIAVLLDDRFMAISNVEPFRLRVNTTMVADGPRELRVEGYADGEGVIATAAVTVVVSNGARTLAPAERNARRLARRELVELLALRATPLTNEHLLGRALQQAGRSAEAIASYEYVFGHDALLPGIRADLLLGYRELGLPADGDPREVYLLDDPGAIALTFDDGPHPVMTPRILDLLDRHGFRATFFLVGKQAAMYPGLVREIAERGHEIGSHSQTHCNLCTLDRLGIEQELVRSRAAIRQACGRTVTLFRPPGGHYDDRVRRAAAATGFTTIFWNENIGNYPGVDGPTIAASMDRKLADGGIVLLHNGYDETEFALPHLLRRLDARDARCKTVSALADVRHVGRG